LAQRDHVEESLHYLMVNVLVDSLEKEGFKVRADHVGGLRERPSAIGDYIPDIEAAKGTEVHLIEVETQNTLDSHRVREQLAKLAAAAYGKAFLAVPFDCLEKARELREELGVDFEILPCYPFVRYIGMPK
jgi:Holliday junction resolvase